jgi:hypothetical protein
VEMATKEQSHANFVSKEKACGLNKIPYYQI